MDFSLLKRVVTSHVRGCGARQRPERPLQPGFPRAVGCDVCSCSPSSRVFQGLWDVMFAPVASTGGKRGREEASEEPWPSGSAEVDLKSPIFTFARPMCSESGA